MDQIVRAIMICHFAHSLIASGAAAMAVYGPADGAPSLDDIRARLSA